MSCFDVYSQKVADWWRSGKVPRWVINCGGRLESRWRPRRTKTVRPDKYLTFTEEIYYFNLKDKCYKVTDLCAYGYEDTLIWGTIHFYFRLNTTSEKWVRLQLVQAGELYKKVSADVAGRDVPTTPTTAIGATLSALAGVPYIGPALGIAGDSIGKSDLLRNIIKHADKFERLAKERKQIERQVGRKQFSMTIPEADACWISSEIVVYFKKQFIDEVPCTRTISALPENTASGSRYRYWLPRRGNKTRLKELIERYGENRKDKEGRTVPDTDEGKITDYRRWYERLGRTKPDGVNEFGN